MLQSQKWIGSQYVCIVCFRWRKQFFAMNELCPGDLMILFDPSILGLFFFGFAYMKSVFSPYLHLKVSFRIDRRFLQVPHPTTSSDATWPLCTLPPVFCLGGMWLQ